MALQEAVQSRRKFLRGSALAAAATVVAPTVAKAQG
ncbi:twin-arginine translocation signal domain-containing protein, partial [Acinetobacter baumannii]